MKGHTIWIFILFFIFLAGMGKVTLAKMSQNRQEQHLERETEIFLNAAVLFVMQKGRVAASYAFNNHRGKFHRGSQYVFAFNCGNPDYADAGFMIASPATPQYNYTNRNKKGTIIHKIVQDSYKKALRSSGQWYEYCWLNPVTHKYQLKRSYVRMLPKKNLCVASGYYFSKPCSF